MSETVHRLYTQGKDLHRFTPETIKITIEKAARFALPYLKNGRQRYDVPHTANVDYFAMKISRDEYEHIDELVLRTSAWLHDVGYSINKKSHNKHSLEIANQFFNENYQFYTEEQIYRILRIINIHDNIAEIKEVDEIAFMEADVLSAMVTDTSKFENFRHAAAYTGNNLVHEISKFKTKKGKELLKTYLPTFLNSLYTLPTI